MWNLRLGAVYGPDRRPCPLWPLVVFPEDVDRKIADLLAPQPRLPTPQHYRQIKHPMFLPRKSRLHSQWRDAVNRFINNYWDSGVPLRPFATRYAPMVFVDWDDKGCATIDLSRALAPWPGRTVATLMDSDDSDDEHMSDDI